MVFMTDASVLDRPMIHKYSNETQTKWNHGKFKVQLMVPGSNRPIGFCDGSAEDIAELESIAEAEGAEEVTIQRKRLKSGNEIWTLGGGGGPSDDEEWQED